MAPTCTTCEDQALEFHCPRSTQCEWWKCPECAAVYDVENGVKVSFGGIVERL